MKQKTILILLLITSIIIVLCNNIIFKDTSEFFEYGSEFGFILSRLSLAYISSYIFYLLVVVLKENKNKRNINGAVYSYTSKLISFGYSIFDEVMEASGTNRETFDRATINKTDFQNLCDKSNPGAVPKDRFIGNPFNMTAKNYAQFLYFSTVEKVSHFTEKVFNYMPFLDSELVGLINNLLDTKWYKEHCQFMNWGAKANTNMTSFGNEMFEYLECVRAIENYNEKHKPKDIK